jgi:two-component system chemotaxis response regulator CheY
VRCKTIPTIFIVEDEPSLRSLYQIVLEFHGFEIIGEASNGEEAVQKFENFNSKPDVIIMDHRMPVKNGLEATREILKIDPSAQIIIASADMDIEDKARSIGIASFKPKPFSNDRLVRNVKKALNNKVIAY